MHQSGRTRGNTWVRGGPKFTEGQLRVFTDQQWSRELEGVTLAIKIFVHHFFLVFCYYVLSSVGGHGGGGGRLPAVLMRHPPSYPPPPPAQAPARLGK